MPGIRRDGRDRRRHSRTRFCPLRTGERMENVPRSPVPRESQLQLSQALNHKIRELMQQHHWSQRAFAARLGMSQSAVSYLLRQKRRATALDFYERLAQVFGLPLSGLIADLEARVAAASSTPGRRRRRTTPRELSGLEGASDAVTPSATVTRLEALTKRYIRELDEEFRRAKAEIRKSDRTAVPPRQLVNHADDRSSVGAGDPHGDRTGAARSGRSAGIAGGR